MLVLPSFSPSPLPNAAAPQPTAARPQEPGLLRYVPGCGPQRDPDQAYAGLQHMGSALADGRMSVDTFNRQLPTLHREIAAAMNAPQAPGTSRAVLADLAGADRLSVEDIAAAVEREGGLRTTGEASLAVNQEHHFDMSYAPGGGFTGSRSYETPGETPVLGLDVLQKPGAGPDDPAAVRLRYSYPAFFTFDTHGTPFEERSGSDSLYFLKRRADAAELESLLTQKRVVADVATVRKSFADVTNALDSLSPVSFHNDSYGFGEVGTTYREQIKMPVSFGVPEQTMGPVSAVMAENALTSVLDVHSGPALAAPPVLSRTASAFRGAALLGAIGAVASGIGFALGPVGLGTTALVTAGLSVATGALFATQVDGTTLKANGYSDDEILRERWDAFATGAVLGGAAGATATLGGSIPRAAITGGSWVVAGAALGGARRL